MSSLQELFGKVAQQIANDPLVGDNYHKVTERLLRFAAGQGMTLKDCSSPLFMARSMRTLKKHVRRINDPDLKFTDYTPRKLVPKKEKVKKSRAKKS